MRAPASRCEGARRRPGLGFCVDFAEAATGPPLIGVGLDRSGPFTVDVWTDDSNVVHSGKNRSIDYLSSRKVANCETRDL